MSTGNNGKNGTNGACAMAATAARASANGQGRGTAEAPETVRAREATAPVPEATRTLPIAAGSGQEEPLSLLSYRPADINNAYHDGRLYYPTQILVRGADAEGTQAVVVRSDRTVLRARYSTPLEDSQPVCRLDDGTLIAGPPKVTRHATWGCESISAYLNGAPAARDPAALLATSEAHLRGSVWLPRQEDYTLLAVTVAVTYTQAIFDAVPLLLVCGPAGSGKSQLGQAMVEICANAAMIGKASAATIARTIDESRGFVVLDDQENLGKNRGGFTELGQTIKLSYKKSTAVKDWTDKGDMKPKRLNFYGVKMINNTSGVDAILLTRMFRIPTRKRPAHAIAMAPPDTDLQALRDDLHTWAFCNVAKIAGAYADLCPSGRAREEEIAAPLRAIARLAGGEWPARLERALARQNERPSNIHGIHDLLRAAVASLQAEGFHRVAPVHVILKMREIAADSGIDGACAEISPIWVGRLLRENRLVDPSAPEEKRRIAGIQTRILTLASAAKAESIKPPLSFCGSCSECPHAHHGCPILVAKRSRRPRKNR